MLVKVSQEYKDFERKFNRAFFSVRPWILEDYAKKLDINMITQFALYKCMYGMCSFACDSEENWQIHMDQHINLMDAINDEKMLTNEYRAELIKFRECAYCGNEPHTRQEKLTATTNAVRRHMEMEHRRSTLQCASCFYRSIEMDSMVYHMEKFHPGSKDILLYGTSREFQDDDVHDFEGCQEQNIKRIKCNLGE